MMFMTMHRRIFNVKNKVLIILLLLFLTLKASKQDG